MVGDFEPLTNLEKKKHFEAHEMRLISFHNCAAILGLPTWNELQKVLKKWIPSDCQVSMDPLSSRMAESTGSHIGLMALEKPSPLRKTDRKQPTYFYHHQWWSGNGDFPSGETASFHRPRARICWDYSAASPSGSAVAPCAQWGDCCSRHPSCRGAVRTSISPGDRALLDVEKPWFPDEKLIYK